MSLHRSIVKTLIYGPLALADLQSAMSVSLPTLRKAVQDLTEAHWIRVVGQAEANGGRPAMLFGLDTSQYLIVGVHLQLPGMRLVVSDLDGRTHDETELFSKAVPSPAQAVDAIVKYVESIRVRFAARTLLGVGIATPGFLDSSNGDVLLIGRVPGWRNFPLARQLQTLLEMPIYVANDIDSMAFAEFHRADNFTERNLAYVGFDEGVKVSLFLRGKLYQSSLGNAGLIASPLLYVEGIPDRQDVRDLLTLVGISQLFQRRIQALTEGEQAAYAPLLALSPRRRVLSILQNDSETLPVCRDLAHQIVLALGSAIANIVLMVQPDEIVIGGVLSQMALPLFDDLRRAISSHLPQLIDHHITIQQGSFSSSSNAAIGAVHHFLESYLSAASAEYLLVAPHNQ